MVYNEYESLLEANSVEFYQIAMLLLVKKLGGSVAFTEKELSEAHKLQGDIERLSSVGKVVIKVTPRATDFNEQKAKDYFSNPKNQADGYNEATEDDGA
jgi:hypothetical protein